MRTSPIQLSIFLAAATLVAEEKPIDFKRQVLPILEEKCFKCHSVAEGKEKGGVALDYPDEVKRHIGDQEIIVPGSAADSDLLRLILLDEDHKESMPPPGKGDALTQKEVVIVRDWILQGASLERGGAPMADADADEKKYESWKSSDGKELKAAFRKVEAGSVELLLESGKVVKVPFARLDEDSQKLARLRFEEEKSKKEGSE